MTARVLCSHKPFSPSQCCLSQLPSRGCEFLCSAMCWTQLFPLSCPLISLPGRFFSHRLWLKVLSTSQDGAHCSGLASESAGLQRETQRYGRDSGLWGKEPLLGPGQAAGALCFVCQQSAASQVPSSSSSVGSTLGHLSSTGARGIQWCPHPALLLCRSALSTQKSRTVLSKS